MIIDAQSRLGNKWIDVAALLPGRTANSIKNRWNATLLPRLRRQMAPRAASCPIYNMDAAMPAGAAAVTQGAGQKRCAESSLLDYRLWGKRMCPQEPGASPHASSSGAIVPADTLMGMHDLRSAQWSMLSHLVAQQLQQSALPVPVLPQLKLLPKAGDERAAPARAGSTSPSSTEYGASASPSPVRTPPDENGLLPSMRSYISSTRAVDALSQAAPAQHALPTSQAFEGVSLDLHRALVLQQQQEQQQRQRQEQQQRQELELLLHLMLNNKMQAAAATPPAHPAPQGQAPAGAHSDKLQAGPHNDNLNLLLTALMREEQAAQATPGSQAESVLKQHPHLVPA